LETPAKKPSKKVAIIIAIIAVIVILIIAALFVFKPFSNKQTATPAPVAEEISEKITTCPEGITVNGVSFAGLDFDSAAQQLSNMEQEIADKLFIRLLYGGYTHTVYGSDLNLSFNKEAVLEHLFSEASQNGSVDFSLIPSIDEKDIAAIVSDISSDIDTPAVDATIAMDPQSPTHEFVSYIPSVTGISVDQSALQQALSDTVTDLGGFITIPVQTQEPSITVEDLQAKFVLRSTGQTSFAKSPYNRESRVFNIKKAVGLVNGTVLDVGETFSANNTLGNRTYAAGWQPAPAIVQGRDEDQAGGGVCQVSTTLYQAVLKADLEIVYRRGHSKLLGYVDGGLDATIDSGNIDFLWKNNTNSPIYVFCYVDDENKTVNFFIYGEPLPEEYDEIQLSSKKIETIEPTGEMLYTVDPTKPFGFSEVLVKRKNGSKWHSYATYYKNGEVVKTEFVAETIYKAFNGETIVGPTPAPVETPAPDTQNDPYSQPIPGLPNAYYTY